MANENVYLKRFTPDCRSTGKKELRTCELEKFPFDSVTDKEAYRVTLASMRGSLASGLGSPTAGSYSIPAGKEYNPNEDLSFLNRPDITIVMLDNYIKEFESRLKSADADLKVQIENELAQAKAKKEQLQTVDNNSVSDDK